MADNFTSIWNRLRLRASSIEAPLAQDYVRDAFNQLAERREWSWTVGHSGFFPPSFPVTNDTATVTPNSPVFVSAGGRFTPNMVGMQIRVGGIGGSSYPTYTIVSYLGPTTVVVDYGWVGPNLTATYIVFQCYYPVPRDFQYFISLVNTTSNYRLWTNLTQAELDLADPQRIQQGITFATAYYDTTPTFSGTIEAAIQIIGSGTSPVSTTSTGYTYPDNSIYTVQIVTGGALGTATWQWKQNSGPWSPLLTTPTDESAYFMADGVAVYFPAGTYDAGDTFIIQATAFLVQGVPRYELWPRPILTPYVYPYIYRKIPPVLTDDNPALPYLIANRGDVLLEMALANAAKWPGSSTDRNPYYDLRLASMHEAKAERLLNELERKDDDTAIKDLGYKNIPFYPAPWLDGSWLQTHAIYPSP